MFLNQRSIVPIVLQHCNLSIMPWNIQYFFLGISLIPRKKYWTFQGIIERLQCYKTIGTLDLWFKKVLEHLKKKKGHVIFRLKTSTLDISAGKCDNKMILGDKVNMFRRFQKKKIFYEVGQLLRPSRDPSILTIFFWNLRKITKIG